MRSNVIITFDMEASIAGAFDDFQKNKPLLHEPVWGEDANGNSQALGFILNVLQKNDLRATFFVETAHTHYFDQDIMGQYTQRLTQNDQDVQLHLHPCWTNFKKLPPELIISDNCNQIDSTLLIDLMKQGIDLIETWTGKKPIAMRTGNFASSLNVFTAMKEAKLQLSSNICMGISPPKEESIQLTSGVKKINGIVELPSTSFLDKKFIGQNKLRPLQITSCSDVEFIQYLNLLHSKSTEYIVLLSHPFEFLKWDNVQFKNLRANRLIQKRFENICQYLATNQDRFNVTTFGALDPSKLNETPSTHIEGSRLLSFKRSIQHVLNDKILK